MANISGTYYSNSSYYPRFTYNISYSEIGRSGSSVSYRFNVSFSRSNNWYGYDIQVNWNINGSTGSKQILAANVNSASGSITFDVTTSTNAAGGTLPARIYTTSNTDSTHYQNAIDTGSQTVNKSTFNTPPSISGTVSTSPGGTFSEKQSSVAVSWPAATDSNNNLSGYRLRVSVNGGGSTELTRTTGRSYSHNISGYGEGTSFMYTVDAYDSYGEWSGNIYSATIKKNTFTNDTLASSDSINFNTASINFTYSGGNNTQGGVTISRSLKCDNGITVYNGSNLTSPATVAIYKSGNTPSGPYIKFDELKSRFGNTNDKGKGTITFTLSSTNSNGTTKTSNKSMSVNLQANPNLVTNAAISLIQSESTNYLSVASSSNKYFIPDGSKVTRVKWTPTTGALGEAVKYQVYVAYGNGGWNWLADLPTGSSYYNHVVPTQTSSQQFKYLIRSISVYSDSLIADMPTVAQILHYYNQPGLTEGVKTRQSATCEVKFTVRSVSSIPNINTVGSWKAYKQDTTTPVISSGNLTVSQNEQTINVTGLNENDRYDVVVTYNDNTGLTANAKTATLVIGPFLPAFHINKYGIGVGGVVANSTYPLLVKGSIGITDGLFNGASGIFAYQAHETGMGMAIQSGGAMVIGSGESPRAFMDTLPDKSIEKTFITSDGGIDFVTNCQTIGSRVTVSLGTDGTFNASNVQVNGNDVYHKGNLPDPRDLAKIGYDTRNTEGSMANQWCKIATITIPNRYGDSSGIVDILDSGSGSSVPVAGRLYFRVKQQNALGEAPMVSMYLTDYTQINPGDFQAVTTTNNTTNTIVQIWFRNRVSYTSVGFTPIKLKGNIAEFHSIQNYQVSLPAGTKNGCVHLMDQKAVKAIQRHHSSDWTSAGPMSGKTFAGGYHSGNTANQYMSFAAAGTASMDFFIDGEYYADDGNNRVYHAGWCGSITKDSPRVSNLNTIYTSGWNSWSGGGTGTPNSYGVVLTIIWGTAGDANADRYQFAMCSNNTSYCRQFVNAAWSSWRTV